MPHLILHAETIAQDIRRIELSAPSIARRRQAGQFIVLRVNKTGERIPLTIVDSDTMRESITLIVQGIGHTTRMLNALNTGEFVEDLAGPLGRPSNVKKVGTVVVIGGGVGTAVAFSTAKALKQAGNRVIAINGARSQNMIILEKELKDVCDETYITTDDGSYGFHGLVTGKLKEIIESGEKVDEVLAVGPLPMMQAVEAFTKPLSIPNTVSLNPVMVDGIGMCGGCRATVDEKTVFVCVEGPEFDAHKVDFNSLILRNRAYRNQEAHSCKLEANIKTRGMQP